MIKRLKQIFNIQNECIFEPVSKFQKQEILNGVKGLNAFTLAEMLVVIGIIGVEIFKGAIDQLKRFKDDVKEVAQGFECGISFAKFNDLKEGDIIEVSTTEEVERKSL